MREVEEKRFDKGAVMVVIDKERCTGCGTCVKDCVSRNLVVEDGCARVLDSCFNCGHCVAICPHAAPSIPEYPATCVDYSASTFDIATENLLNTVKFRRSIRDFEDRAVSMEDLHILMDAASHMPTAKNTQSCRFVFVQDSLPEFRDVVWRDMTRWREAGGHEGAFDAGTLERFFTLREGSPSQDYLFRNAPAVLLIEAPDPVDAGLAAAAIELVGATRGIGVLYDGYLRRALVASEGARAYTDSSPEKPLHVCMLVGYPRVRYCRTAPRRNPSVVLR